MTALTMRIRCKQQATPPSLHLHPVTYGEGPPQSTFEGHP